MEAACIQAACAWEEGGMNNNFQQRMALFLEQLVSESTNPCSRTIVSICKAIRLDRKVFEGLAMYALAKRWIKMQPVGVAKVHTITRLGRRAYKDLKAGADISLL